jgi:large subunit ribosomal protein L4e
MCRGGRMFSPTKVWRKWHIKISKGQRRYATCSALAASALAPLVMARGHRVEAIAEIPLVVSDTDFETVSKTKHAVALLKVLGVNPDLERVSDSRGIRRGKGKARNRRYVQRRGPLIIHARERGTGNTIAAFRNIPGVDVCNVHRLNLLQLAPGGHVGRFVIWTESAIKELNNVFGTRKEDSKEKKGFRPPMGIVTSADIGRIINSDEVQSALRPAKKNCTFVPRKRNPLINLEAMVKLNPFVLTQKKRAALVHKNAAKKRHTKVQSNRKFITQLHEPSIAPVRGEDEIHPF